MKIISNKIDNIDIGKLYSYFSLPFTVKELLSSKKKLEDDEEYALHEILSEMQPDCALIAIALCARHIANHINNNRGGNLLSHSAFIIGEYAPTWLSNAENNNNNDYIFQDMLMDIPEDLSLLSVLLTGCASKYHDKQNPVAKICNILAVQAASHSDIAQAYLDAIKKSEEKSEKGYNIPIINTEDNIIRL